MIATTAVLAMHAGLADAQILRRPVTRSQPNWLGGGVTINQPFTLRDGLTDSEWRFDSGMGYMATFEHPTQSGMVVGLQGTYATPALIYTSNSATGPVDCLGGCEATAAVTQITGLIKSGNGYAFHPVYQLTVGATGFSNFRDHASGTKLGPAKTDYDFSFAIGYGFGFSFSSSAAVEVIQEIGTLMHQKTGLAVGSGNYPRMSVTKLGGKISF